MKRILPLLICFSFSSMQGQIAVIHHPVTIVSFQNPMTPLIILEHFSRNYSDAIPFWGMEGKHYTVRYIDPETALGHKLVYDKHGTIVRSENEMALSECPQNLLEYYVRNYPDEQLRVWSYEENSGDRRYFIRHNTRIVWFDKEGRYMRRRLIWN
jgi:hypothetical protein